MLNSLNIECPFPFLPKITEKDSFFVTFYHNYLLIGIFKNNVFFANLWAKDEDSFAKGAFNVDLFQHRVPSFFLDKNHKKRYFFVKFYHNYLLIGIFNNNVFFANSWAKDEASFAEGALNVE